MKWIYQGCICTLKQSSGTKASNLNLKMLDEQKHRQHVSLWYTEKEKKNTIRKQKRTLRGTKKNILSWIEQDKLNGKKKTHTEGHKKKHQHYRKS